MYWSVTMWTQSQISKTTMEYVSKWVGGKKQLDASELYADLSPNSKWEIPSTVPYQLGEWVGESVSQLDEGHHY